MLVGIDVGGTYTDGVVFDQGQVVASAKVPTDEQNLQESVLQVLDQLLGFTHPDKIQRVVLSTTLVTNVLATGQGEPTALLLLPGYGLPHEAYQITPDTYYLKGAVDFRGREIEALDPKELAGVALKIARSGVKRLAVAAKFANRNHALEKQVENYMQKNYPDILVSISSEVSGQLNFPRRAVTAYFTAMTLKEWNHFADEIEEAMRQRKINCEVDVLKADGGTLPLAVSRTMPCETVFSGPAASTMGALALSRDQLNSVVVDVGGTTSDISLIIGGEPLYASKGARIEEHYTQVNAFAVRSIALGGDSTVSIENENTMVQKTRRGVALCFGGQYLTLTDIFNCHYKLAIGEMKRSQEGLEQIASEAKLEPDVLCRQVIDRVCEQLYMNIQEMFDEWEKEPAYKVWEVIHRRKFGPDQIIGIGAAAGAILPPLAEKMQLPLFLHDYAAVANALGASVVRPTLRVQLHVDTQTNVCTVDPGGIKTSLENPRNFQLEDAKSMARQYLNDIGRARGMASYTDQHKFFMAEQFNMIRGYNSSGKLFDVGIQVTPGFVEEFKGVK